MASIPGSQFVYGASQPVNLVSNPSGGTATLPPPISGDFNLEVVTVSGVTSIPSGYAGVAEVANDTPSGANSVTMLLGNYGVSDVESGDTIIAGSGSDTIFGNVAGDDIVFGTGAASIYGAHGDTINGSAAGTGSYIDASGAFTGGASADVITLGNVANFVATQGSLFGLDDTITAGSGNWVINTQFQNGTQQGPTVAANMDVTLGSGADTVYGAVGDTINGANAGSGSYIDAILGHQNVTLGSQANFVPGQDVAFGFDDTITAGSGNWIINTQFQDGTQQSPTVAANMDVMLGSGADTAYGAVGDTITAGSGNQYIDFAAGHGAGGGEFLNDDTAATIGGNATVYNFDQSTGDRITGESPSSQAGVLATATTVGSDTQLTLTDGTHITLVGVTNFSASFFS
ncbi:MAG TPA: hypothetical protein VME41_10280 [Stellaceae bacterium]|nr:hypothetical protein [Stellaceae bacterium]